MKPKTCPHCAGPMYHHEPTREEYGGHECEECGHFEADPDEYTTDNGPTGHGDLCLSDADPGL